MVALAEGRTLKFEWKQVCSSPQDSAQYSTRSKQCCSFDGLVPSSAFQLSQSPFQAFGNRSKGANYNWYYRHLYVPQLS